MNTIKSYGVAVLLATMFIATGCQTPGDGFTTYKDTWAVAHAAYKAHCERVVQGKVTAERELLADTAWNQFRVTFKESLVASRTNMTAPAPVPLKDAAKTYVRLVKP